MTDATGRLITLVAYDEDGIPRPLLVDADGSLLISPQGAAEGGALKTPSGKLFTPVANDPDDIPRPFLVDADGYLKVAGAGGMAVIYDDIRTDLGNWQITEISQEYENLEIVIFGRSDFADLRDYTTIFFNGDLNETHYRYALHWSGSAHGGAMGDLSRFGAVTGATATAFYAGAIFAKIPGYSETTYCKVIRSYSGHRRNAADMYMNDFFTHWESAAAINQIDIKADLGTGFLAGSRLQIYGTP